MAIATVPSSLFINNSVKLFEMHVLQQIRNEQSMLRLATKISITAHLCFVNTEGTTSIIFAVHKCLNCLCAHSTWSSPFARFKQGPANRLRIISTHQADVYPILIYVYLRLFNIHKSRACLHFVARTHTCACTHPDTYGLQLFKSVPFYRLSTCPISRTHTHTHQKKNCFAPVPSRRLSTSHR